MEAKQILKKMRLPKGTTITIGGEVIVVGPHASPVIKGKSLAEIDRIVRAASKEKIFRD
ncbi:MAG: hypothetical protein AAB929_03875 [Patescibacteria group bacterium]